MWPRLDVLFFCLPFRQLHTQEFQLSFYRWERGSLRFVVFGSSAYFEFGPRDTWKSLSISESEVALTKWIRTVSPRHIDYNTIRDIVFHWAPAGRCRQMSVQPRCSPARDLQYQLEEARGSPDEKVRIETIISYSKGKGKKPLRLQEGTAHHSFLTLIVERLRMSYLGIG